MQPQLRKEDRYIDRPLTPPPPVAELMVTFLPPPYPLLPPPSPSDPGQDPGHSAEAAVRPSVQGSLHQTGCQGDAAGADS